MYLQHQGSHIFSQIHPLIADFFKWMTTFQFAKKTIALGAADGIWSKERPGRATPLSITLPSHPSRTQRRVTFKPSDWNDPARDEVETTATGSVFSYPPYS